MKTRKEIEKEIISLLGELIGRTDGKIKDLRSTYSSLEKIEKTTYVYMKTIRSIVDKILKNQGKL